MFIDKVQVLGDSGCIIGAQLWWEGKRDVDWKLERVANGSHTSQNICAVDGAAVPGIAGGHGSWDPDGGIIAIIGGNSDGFVDEVEVSSHADCFMVSFCHCMEVDAESLTHGFEGGKEIAAGIDHDQAAHAKLE